MIMSPVQIKTEDGRTINGVLFEKEDVVNIISLINRTNSDGLKGADTLVMMQLHDAVKDLEESEK